MILNWFVRSCLRARHSRLLSAQSARRRIPRRDTGAMHAARSATRHTASDVSACRSVCPLQQRNYNRRSCCPGNRGLLDQTPPKTMDLCADAWSGASVARTEPRRLVSATRPGDSPLRVIGLATFISFKTGRNIEVSMPSTI